MPRGRHLVWLFLAASAFTFPTRGLAQEFAVPASGRAAIISETNAYRQAKGLAPLRESPSADRVAQSYATFLARTGKTGHGADGSNPVARLRAAGIKYCKFRGENWHESWTRPNRASTSVAMGKAMRFWKQSPGHERALRSASTEIGVGVAGWRHGNQWYYVSVQMFFDTSCFRPAPEASPPSLPDRNPTRTESP